MAPRNLHQDAIKLLYYPIILIVCIVPVFICRLVQFIFKEDFFEFFIFSSFLWSLHGFFDALAYAMSKPVVGYVKSKVFLKENTLNESEFAEVERGGL
jgi:hypothetical protein